MACLLKISDKENFITHSANENQTNILMPYLSQMIMVLTLDPLANPVEFDRGNPPPWGKN